MAKLADLANKAKEHTELVTENVKNDKGMNQKEIKQGILIEEILGSIFFFFTRSELVEI